MTEFEMAYLLNDTQLAITANSSVLFTMVSAFLVASYVGAHRLSPLMIALLIGMYAYAYFGIAFTLARQMTTAFGLVRSDQHACCRGQRLSVACSGGGVGRQHDNRNYPLLRPPNQSGDKPCHLRRTLVFFFHCRRVNRKAETVVEALKV